MKTWMTLWMLLGVVGFPAAVGWFLHRVQRFGKAANEPERVRERTRLNHAGIAALALLLVLISFIVYLKITMG